MSTKRAKRLEASTSAVGQAEIALLAADPAALAKLDLFTPEEMKNGIDALLETNFRDDGAQDELIGLKIMVVKLIATLQCMDGLTFSMDGRENMELLRNRVLGS